MNVVVLGSSGMLGSSTCKYLSEHGKQFKLLEVNRQGQAIVEGNQILRWDFLSDPIEILSQTLEDVDFVINCIGLIHQKFPTEKNEAIKKAIQLNSMFPYQLSDLSKRQGFRIIQIGTDCVFSGQKGAYRESDLKDPIDVYGYSKALGEIFEENTIFLRSSIIGLEKRTNSSLMQWLISRPRNSEVPGFVNHKWNGMTTLAFARICLGLIQSGMTGGIGQHLIPSDAITKYELLKEISNAFNRKDLRILSTQHQRDIDRTLETDYADRNQDLWKLGGYRQVPSIKEMIIEYAEWAAGANSSGT